MATTLALRSERRGAVQLVAQVLNIVSSADYSEQYLLPAGFGDCVIVEMSVQMTGIQTAVANSELRGPLVTLTSTSTMEAFILPRWTKFTTGTALVSHDQLERGQLWQASEVMQVLAAFEDTGAGNTADQTVLVKVVRLRNQV